MSIDDEDIDMIVEDNDRTPVLSRENSNIQRNIPIIRRKSSSKKERLSERKAEIKRTSPLMKRSESIEVSFKQNNNYLPNTSECQRSTGVQGIQANSPILAHKQFYEQSPLVKRKGSLKIKSFTADNDEQQGRSTDTSSSSYQAMRKSSLKESPRLQRNRLLLLESFYKNDSDSFEDSTTEDEFIQRASLPRNIKFHTNNVKGDESIYTKYKYRFPIIASPIQYDRRILKREENRDPSENQESRTKANIPNNSNNPLSTTTSTTFPATKWYHTANMQVKEYRTEIKTVAKEKFTPVLCVGPLRKKSEQGSVSELNSELIETSHNLELGQSTKAPLIRNQKDVNCKEKSLNHLNELQTPLVHHEKTNSYQLAENRKVSEEPNRYVKSSYSYQSYPETQKSNLRSLEKNNYVEMDPSNHESIKSLDRSNYYRSYQNNKNFSQNGIFKIEEALFSSIANGSLDNNERLITHDQDQADYQIGLHRNLRRISTFHATDQFQTKKNKRSLSSELLSNQDTDNKHKLRKNNRIILMEPLEVNWSVNELKSIFQRNAHQPIRLDTEYRSKNHR